MGSVAIVHDYLTQRGGAERVVLAMMRAFPDAELHTSLYDPDRTFPEFKQFRIRTMPINRIGLLRRYHRAALPLLAASFSAYNVEADVVICSSSGWAHGVRTDGRKIVYCHAPARWLYQSERYIGRDNGTVRKAAMRAALGALRRPLIRWDRRAANTAADYVVNSRAVQQQVREVYEIDAHVLHPPVDDLTRRPEAPVAGVRPGFLLCVSRLLPYKNVDVLLAAMRLQKEEHLIVAGTGPDGERLRSVAPDNVAFVGPVADNHLAWLYDNCSGVVAPSYEDFGLVPIEAAAFGKPSVALAWGGFLDTIVDGKTGILFDALEPAGLAEAIGRLRSATFEPSDLRAHHESFSEASFVARFREVARPCEVTAVARPSGSLDRPGTRLGRKLTGRRQ